MRILCIEPGLKNIIWSFVDINNKNDINFNDIQFDFIDLQYEKCTVDTTCCKKAIFSIPEGEFICCKEHGEIFVEKKRLKVKNFSQIAEKIIIELQELEKNYLKDIDYVLVENQLNSDSKVKNICIIIFSYFLTKQFKTILFNPTVKSIDVDKKKMEIIDRKNASGKKILEILPKIYKKKLINNSKLYDIADLLLQTIYFFKHSEEKI